MSDVLLDVTEVTKHFPITEGIVFRHEVASVRALDGVSLQVRRGETLGIVGESGCGKSTLARVITRLLEPTSGTVRFDGRDISRLSQDELRPVDRLLAKELHARGADVTFHIWPGGHDGDYWNKHFDEYVKFYADACD